MASLKEIRGRINSIRGTLKITSAMRLIASAKLRSAQKAIGNMVPYEEGLHRILARLLNTPGAGKALDPYRECTSERTAVILLTSNQSLCGSFNANIEKAFANAGFDPASTDVYAVGKHGMKAARKLGFEPRNCCKMAEKPDYDASVALADNLVSDYTSGKIGKAVLIYAHFESGASQPVKTEVYLPFAADGNSTSGDASNGTDYITEPEPTAMLEQLLPMVMRLKLHTVFLDSAAAEHAARTFAMQVASDNAENLISELSLTYNKLRQQAITSEILDLIGGQTNN